MALGWKKKVGKDKTSEEDGATSPAPKLGGGAKGLLAALKAAKNKEEEQPKQKEEKITGTKMLFAMSANKDEDNQKVKVWFHNSNQAVESAGASRRVWGFRSANQGLESFASASHKLALPPLILQPYLLPTLENHIFSTLPNLFFRLSRNETIV